MRCPIYFTRQFVEVVRPLQHGGSLSRVVCVGGIRERQVSFSLTWGCERREERELVESIENLEMVSRYRKCSEDDRKTRNPPVKAQRSLSSEKSRENTFTFVYPKGSGLSWTTLRILGFPLSRMGVQRAEAYFQEVRPGKT